MKTKININGKEVEIELTEEQVKAITEQTKLTHTGYERKTERDFYFIGDAGGELQACIATDKPNTPMYDELFSNANYMTDKRIAEDRAKLFNVLNAMYKWAAENTESAVWDNGKMKYTPMYDYSSGKITTASWDTYRDSILPHFVTIDKCNEFILRFANELIWLFAEFTYRVAAES